MLYVGMYVGNVFVPYYVFLLFCILAVVGDMVSTRIALNRGFSEGNPIMAKFKDPVLASGIISLVVIVGISAIARYEPIKSSWFMLLTGIYRWFCAGLNIRRLLKGKPKD